MLIIVSIIDSTNPKSHHNATEAPDSENDTDAAAKQKGVSNRFVVAVVHYVSYNMTALSSVGIESFLLTS